MNTYGKERNCIGVFAGPRKEDSNDWYDAASDSYFPIDLF